MHIHMYAIREVQFSTNDAFNASAEIADSVNYPNLRLYTIKCECFLNRTK